MLSWDAVAVSNAAARNMRKTVENYRNQMDNLVEHANEQIDNANASIRILKDERNALKEEVGLLKKNLASTKAELTQTKQNLDKAIQIATYVGIRAKGAIALIRKLLYALSDVSPNHELFQLDTCKVTGKEDVHAHRRFYIETIRDMMVEHDISVDEISKII